MSLITSLRPYKSAACLLLGAGLALVASPASAQSAAAAAAAPFEHLSGAWSGNGAVKLANGSKERIRCRVNYNVAASGMSFRQNLRCASDSYTFDLNSDIAYANGTITGRWTETTRNKSGYINGRVKGNQIEALAETNGFAAFLTVTTNGGRQQVTIQSKNADISNVSISLSRGSR
jgi:hypothetical protein